MRKKIIKAIVFVCVLTAIFISIANFTAPKLKADEGMTHIYWPLAGACMHYPWDCIVVHPV